MADYNHYPVIPRTGLDYELDGVVAITNEMLWTTDTMCLYVEQDGEKIVIGGKYSNPAILYVGAESSPVIKGISTGLYVYDPENLSNLIFQSAPDTYIQDTITHRYGSRFYPVDPEGNDVTAALYIENPTWVGEQQQYGLLMYTEQGAALGISSKAPSTDVIYVALLTGAGGYGMEIAAYATTEDATATCSYLASMQAHDQLGKAPNIYNVGFQGVWDSDDSAPLYGMFFSCECPCNSFTAHKTVGANDAYPQFRVVDNDWQRERFVVCNNGDVRLSGLLADSDTLEVDSSALIFRGAWWDGANSVDAEVSICLETIADEYEQETYLKINVPSGGLYDDISCTKIYVTEDDQVALGDTDHRFTNLYLSGAVYTEGVAYTTSMYVIDGNTDCAIGNGKLNFPVPKKLNSFNLSGVTAYCIVPGVTGTMDVQANRCRTTAAIGNSDTQFDITNPGGTTFRYTYDGTGTDPSIADSGASLQIGDSLYIQAQNFSAGNKGRFTLTGVGTNYFEVDNASGAVESNKTIGTGSIVPTKFRNMLSTVVTIDSNEFNSSTASVPVVIDTDYDDLLTNDVLRFDLVDVHTTPAKGLAITLDFA